MAAPPDVRAAATASPASAAGTLRVVDGWNLDGASLYVSESELRSLERCCGRSLRGDEAVAVRHAERCDFCCLVFLRPLPAASGAQAAQTGADVIAQQPTPRAFVTLYCSALFSASSQLTQGDALVLMPCGGRLLDLSAVLLVCYSDKAFAEAKRFLSQVRQAVRAQQQQQQREEEASGLRVQQQQQQQRPTQLLLPPGVTPSQARLVQQQQRPPAAAFAQRGMTALAGLCCALVSADDAPSNGNVTDRDDRNAVFARDIVVAETKPFRRGRLTADTAVYIIRAALAGREAATWKRRKALSAMRKSRTLSSMPDVLLAHYGDTDGAIPLAVELRSEAVASPADFDPLYVVALSPGVLARLSLIDGQHVQVSPASGTGKPRPSAHGARTMVAKADNRVQDECVALTQQAWFNLRRGKSSDSVVFVKRLVPPGLTSTGRGDGTNGGSASGGRPLSSCCDGSEMVLRFAENVFLAVIRSPRYGHAEVESATPSRQAYFNQRRCVKLGDVIIITTKDTQVRIMYKVVNITPKPDDEDEVLMADNVRTKFFLEDHVRSRVPPSGAALPVSPIVRGLGDYADRLVRLARPYLQQQKRRSSGSIRPPVFLLSGPPGCGKVTMLQHVAATLCINYHQINCYDMVADVLQSTEARLREGFAKAMAAVPCLLVLRNIDAVHRDRDSNQENPRTAGVVRELLDSSWPASAEWPLITVVTCSGSRRMVADDVREAFLHELVVEAPSESERRDMLCSLLSSDACDGSVAIGQVAEHTAGFLLGDLVALVAAARRHSYNRSSIICKQQLGDEAPDVLQVSGCLVAAADLDRALLEVQSAHASSSGRPKIPNVKWEDIGGLADVKEAILDTVQLPLQHPELLAQGLRRSGLLLYGPPGTGKTLLAKAVASECSLNFLSVKGPELINKYVGQSEENVRDLFERARQSAPAVIFFDELDSLAPRRGHSGDSGGVMDRVVSQLLAELDGLHRSADVFVIGATNRPDLLDGALLRPGRFDKLLYVGISGNKQEQLRVLRALTRRFVLAPDCRLEDVVECCQPNLTGADLYAACAEAMTSAIKRQIDILESGQCEPNEPPKITVCTADFESALRALVPSVSSEELRRYEALRNAIINNQ